jgi:hypothetical protein
MTDEPQHEEEKFTEKEKRRWAELEEKEGRSVQANNGYVEGEVAQVDEVETDNAVKQLSIDKRPSAKLQEKIRACDLTLRSVNAMVNEVIEIGKSEGFTPKEIGNFICEEMLRSGLSRRTVTNYLPSELKAKPRGVQVAAAKTGTGIREIFSQNPKPRLQQQSIVQFECKITKRDSKRQSFRSIYIPSKFHDQVDKMGTTVNVIIS